MRINKFIASGTSLSRRKADDFIKAGRVSVNGKIIDEFIDVKAGDIVEVDGEIVNPVSEKVYFAFYKPPFVLSATQDDSGKKVVCDYFKEIDMKLFCVGRLDYLSEGLLLVTNDGEFANNVMHPKFKIRKTYLVKTKNSVPFNTIKKMSEGIELEDGYFKPLDIKSTLNQNWIVVAIDVGRNRIIRRFFKAFDIPILKLKRIAIGHIDLGNLVIGKYRKLEQAEVDDLMLATFSKKIKFRNI